jgi:hypothetical protein
MLGSIGSLYFHNRHYNVHCNGRILRAGVAPAVETGGWSLLSVMFVCKENFTILIFITISSKKNSVFPQV